MTRAAGCRRAAARAARAGTAAALALCAGACFRYARVTPPATVPPGEFVRVRLTGEGTNELTRYLGPSVVAFDGRLVAAPGDSALHVAVRMVRTVEGSLQPWAGERAVRVPLDYVAALDQRVVSRKRTALAVGGAVLAVAAISTRGFGLVGGDGGGSSRQPPASIVRGP